MLTRGNTSCVLLDWKRQVGPIASWTTDHAANPGKRARGWRAGLLGPAPVRMGSPWWRHVAGMVRLVVCEPLAGWGRDRKTFHVPARYKSDTSPIRNCHSWYARAGRPEIFLPGNMFSLCYLSSQWKNNFWNTGVKLWWAYLSSCKEREKEGEVMSYCVQCCSNSCCNIVEGALEQRFGSSGVTFIFFPLSSCCTYL
jgi:hypothetical protein